MLGARGGRYRKVRSKPRSFTPIKTRESSCRHFCHLHSSPIPSNRHTNRQANIMPANLTVKEALAASEADKAKVLQLSYSGKALSAGEYVPRADAQSPPEISWPGASETSTYLIVALDLDAPFPSFGVLGPILHWIQPGVTAAASKVLTSSGPFVANYIGPAPPPGSSPHRYTFFLYEQPEGFDGSKWAPPKGQTLPNTKRMWYNLDAWEKTAHLGKPLAVGYFKSN
ncbi:phosphatidylethanolamine-binding protein [Xylariales sp. AK1849]|nr:phosphatidylethanolamine-binding protein [Xylariales sp. AK1849]